MHTSHKKETKQNKKNAEKEKESRGQYEHEQKL